jgi:hypothetical protein
LRRIDAHTHAGLQGMTVAVQAALADLLDNAGKLVSENQRAAQVRVADPRVPVGVQVRAANAHHLDAQQHLSRRRLAGMGNVFHSQITRTV